MFYIAFFSEHNYSEPYITICMGNSCYFSIRTRDIETYQCDPESFAQAIENRNRARIPAKSLPTRQ